MKLMVDKAFAKIIYGMFIVHLIFLYKKNTNGGFKGHEKDKIVFD